MIPNLISRRVRNAFFSVLCVGIGAAFGYLLFNPLISLPIEWVLDYLRPALLASANLDNTEIVRMIAAAAIRTTTDLPNTVLVSGVAGLSLSWLQRKRQILYGALLWPLLLHLAHWSEVSLVKRNLAQLGLPTENAHLLVSPYFPAEAIYVVVTFSAFLIIAMLLDRFLSKKRGIQAAQVFAERQLGRGKICR